MARRKLKSWEQVGLAAGATVAIIGGTSLAGVERVQGIPRGVEATPAPAPASAPAPTTSEKHAHGENLQYKLAASLAPNIRDLYDKSPNHSIIPGDTNVGNEYRSGFTRKGGGEIWVSERSVGDDPGRVNRIYLNQVDVTGNNGFMITLRKDPGAAEDAWHADCEDGHNNVVAVTSGKTVEINGERTDDPAKAQKLLVDIAQTSEKIIGTLMAQPEGPILESPVGGFCDQFAK